MNQYLQKTKEYLRDAKFGLHTLLAALASGFMLASAWTILDMFEQKIYFDSLVYTVEMDKLAFWLILALTAVVLCVPALLLKKPIIIYIATAVTAEILAVLLAIRDSNNIRFAVGLAVVLVIIHKYLHAGDKLELEAWEQKNGKVAWRVAYGAVAAMVVGFTVVVTYFTYLRYMVYTTSTFDFGIFTQMFAYMKSDGLPLTTVERGELLSHFAVHFSPSWYLLLPGYMICPTPLYLYFAHAFVVALGAFPLFRICKLQGLSPVTGALCAALYLAFPTMSASSFYEIHENSLLPVLILYMVYFFLAGKTWPTLGFMLLTLGTKEDAFIYVVCFALYGLIATKRKLLSAVMAGCALVYFVGATSIISMLGGQAMISRFDKYYPPDDKSLVGVIKTCFYNIGYFIKYTFSVEYNDGVKGNKLLFILWTMVPVLFAPFLHKRISPLLLLLPMVVINIMPTWLYQYDPYFQYTYGPMAMVLLASVIAFAAMKPETRRFFLTACVSIALVFTFSLAAPKASGYAKNYELNRDKFEATEQAMQEFIASVDPKTVTVSAMCYEVPHLYMIKNLQTIPDTYGPLRESDYYIMDTRYKSIKSYDTGDILDNYTLIVEAGYIEIWQRNP